MRKKNNLGYWIVPVFRCVDIEDLVGPFSTYGAMLRAARKIKQRQREEDALFWLRLDKGEPPVMGSFSGREMEGAEGSK